VSALTVAGLAPGMSEWQRDLLRYVLRPQGGAIAGIAGGKRCGKSVAACAAAAMLAVTCDVPANQIAVVMDTFSRLRDVHLPIMSQLAPSVGGRWCAGDHEYRWPGGAVVRFRHLDVAGSPTAGNPLEGQTLSAIVGDELQEAHVDYGTIFRERLSRDLPVRVIDADGRDREVMRAPVLVMIGLPMRTWWISLARDLGGRVYRPKTRDNEANLAPGYEAALRASMTERYARSMLDGEDWTPEGQILYGFSAQDYPAGNVLRGVVLDFRRMRTMLSGDLGYRSPHFLLHVEVWPGVWCVVREWAPDGVALPDLCDVLAADVCPRRDWSPGCGRLPVDELVVDPAGAATNDQTGHPDLELLARPQPHGLGLWPMVEPQGPRRAVVPGLQRMNVSLEKRLLLMSGGVYDGGLAAPEGKRTLIRCVQGYQWDPRDPSRPHKPSHDTVSHGVDAWRYGWRRVGWDAMPVPADVGPVATREPEGPSLWDAARDAR
jgi:hypothetical protein